MSPEFPDQNLRQISPGDPELWADKQTDRQRARLQFYKFYINRYWKEYICNPENWQHCFNWCLWEKKTVYTWKQWQLGQIPCKPIYVTST